MGRIIVGVDGSEAATTALEWAVDEARTRGGDIMVDAVMAWHEPVAGGTPPVVVFIDPTELKASYAAELERTVQPLRDAHPDVSIRSLLVKDSPAHALIDASGDADLLVVGSRGRGGFLGLVLGSVSHQVVGHATCPVVVVPHPVAT